MVYLDNNATTRPDPAVVEAVREALERYWHNPSSVHRPGQDARARVELARRAVGELVGARARNVVFTGSGTEAIDLAVRGSLLTMRRRVVATTAVEHAAVRDLVEWLGKRGEVEVRYLPLDGEGVVDVGRAGEVIDDEVGLVSVQWVNNETGAIQPVERVGTMCRERGAVFHCDATQWVGKMPTDMGQLGGAGEWGAGGGGEDDGAVIAGRSAGAVDLLTFSPHKFHGPKGVGVLCARAGVRFAPVVHGAQEEGRRGGTENVPGILGAGVAAQLSAEWVREAGERRRLAGLRDRFERGVLGRVRGAVVNGPRADPGRVWNTTNIGFPRLEAEALLLVMSERGLCASAGAACSSGSLDPSPVLLAMGIPEEIAHGSVRFSLSRDTTGEEIDRAVEIVADSVSRVGGSMVGG